MFISDSDKQTIKNTHYVINAGQKWKKKNFLIIPWSPDLSRTGLLSKVISIPEKNITLYIYIN